MRVVGLLTVIVLFAVLACSEKRKNLQDNRISIGIKDSLHSEILNENREIWIYQPANLLPGEKCPVVYLLDGGWHFHSVTGMIDNLIDNSLVPNMIVIAILNTDRARDLTPTHSMKQTDGTDRDDFKTTGGAEDFTRFIEKELMPYVESKYPVAPYKMLIGHSFGGLFAMNTLVYRPQLFNAYVAIDPSMWWDNRNLLQKMDSALTHGKYPGRILHLSIANTMTKGMDTLRVAQDTSSANKHIRSILELAKLTSKSNKNGLVSRWKYYDQDDHGSVPFIAEYDAFRFIFDYFKPEGNWRDFTPASLTEHFSKVSEKLGYTMLPPEGQVDNIIYFYIGAKKLDKASEFLALNEKNYPESPGLPQTQGELFLAKGDTIRALEYFDKALAMRENSYLRKRVGDLRK